MFFRVGTKDCERFAKNESVIKRGGFLRLIRAALRRVFRLLPSSLRAHVKIVTSGPAADDADDFLKLCGSIVHVGANGGQERALYQLHGLKVVWIEPIPEVYEQLVRNIQPYPTQIAIRALLTDRAGDIVKLNIANNSGLSSSIFQLKLHTEIWPEVHFVDHVKLASETLDGLAKRGAIPQAIDALILDTQGSELLVLKGAQVVLSRVTFVKVEAADFESYEGCATVKTIREFLEGRSFSLVKTTKLVQHPSRGAYYDLLFHKESAR